MSNRISGRGGDVMRNAKNDNFNPMNPAHISGRPGIGLGDAYGGSEKKQFDEQIWHMGKVLGTVKGVFTLSNMPVLQQMALGVLTENGISMNVSPISDDNHQLLLGLQTKGQKQNEKITALINLTN